MPTVEFFAVLVVDPARDEERGANISLLNRSSSVTSVFRDLHRSLTTSRLAGARCNYGERGHVALQPCPEGRPNVNGSSPTTEPIGPSSGSYWSHLRAFQLNAKLFLGSHALTQICLGVFSTIMNVYLLKLGFSKSYIGTFMAMASLATAVSSIPIGIMADRMDRRRTILCAIALTAISGTGQVACTQPQLLLLFSFTKGAATTFQGVVQNPFLMENSSPRERIHLFSVNHALQTVAGMVGSALAGILPFILMLVVDAMGLPAILELSQLRYALAISLIFVVLASLPVLYIKEKPRQPIKRSIALDVATIFRDKTMRDLTFYRVLIGAGAGMTVPFFNVFLTDSLHASSAQVSTVTFGSRVVLTVATLMSPFLVKRFGKVKSVLITQLLSIPALFSIAWVPSLAVVTVLFWVRNSFMNMSSPISTSFAMEIVPAEQRATASSAMSMADSLARTFSQMLGGFMMDTYGNSSPYYITCVIYLFASVFYNRAFAPVEKRQQQAESLVPSS